MGESLPQLNEQSCAYKKMCTLSCLIKWGNGRGKAQKQQK